MKYFVTMYQVIELKSSKLIAHTSGIPVLQNKLRTNPAQNIFAHFDPSSEISG